MKGDFSHWQFDPTENFAGVLQQQGRVLLDRDWNEQTRIRQHWQDQAGSDVIGAGIAAVPALDANGFRVTQASVSSAPNQRVELRVTPGRIWADGILCYLPPDPAAPASDVLRVAEYLQPPIDPTPGSIPPSLGDRDAVILEVSHEELSAFQVPDRLLEPALGGPDAMERVHLRLAFRLFRLDASENCLSILDKLHHDPAAKGRLKVQLQPTVTVPSDCPVVMGGGYSGLEHHLYRIEIAALNAAEPPTFKWSQFNGGLVGRGRLLTGPNRITIDANHAAILNSGLSSFYCEVVGYDPARGNWSPTFGADVTLLNGELVVGTVRLGAFSASSSTVFFRLWNGIRLISDFTNSVSPQELLDGIQLVFEPATAINYAPGDYWTFAVRAGEITNPAVLVDNLHPFGPVYQRVPLAEIDWGTAGAPVVPPQIEDCRRRFRPLTRLETCCTVRVGKDGLGDFTSVQDAINALPPEGGKICILPGEYQEQKPITLDNRQNITISGCGPRTRLVAAASASGADAVITIHGGNRLAIESLAIEASPTGRGILALGHNKFSQVAQVATGLIEGLSLKGLELKASALAAVRAEFVNDLLMRECVVRMEDTHCNENAVVVLADHAHLEHNVIEVPGRETHSPATATVGGSRFVPGTRNLGGLHLKSLCHRVRVIDNLIRGGSGNGITLGSQAWYFDGDRNKPVPLEKEPEVPAGDPCDPLLPIDLVFLGRTVEIGDGIRIRLGAGGPLYHLRVERNRIYGMGSNGIAVIGFFDLSATDEFITVLDLSILGNEIRGCLRRTITQPSDSLRDYLGYGGIALADVQNLVVQDNTIVDNGRNHLDPVCGVFVLHGKGIDLSRNRIAGNGKRTSEGPTNARRGHRGGVVIPFALSPTIEIIVGETTFPVPNGVPAARLHQNIISAPLGRALTLSGIGPMSIVANQLTSHGVLISDLDPTGFLAGTVYIVNLGISIDAPTQFLLYGALARKRGAEHVSSFAKAVPSGRRGLDDFVPGRLLANGQVLFSGNQLNLDLLDGGQSLALTSVLILTLDDIGFHDNQCEAILNNDTLIAHGLLFGLSQRTVANRWKEGGKNAWLSALTLSYFMNTTTDNQGTHCIVTRCGLPTHIVDEHNIVLIQGVLGESQGPCDVLEGFLPGLRKPKT